MGWNLWQVSVLGPKIRCRIGTRQVFKRQKGTFLATEWVSFEFIVILFIFEKNECLANCATAYILHEWANSGVIVGAFSHEWEYYSNAGGVASWTSSGD